MENIERFINNDKYFDERFCGEPDVTFTLKENPQFNIYMWAGFLYGIANDPFTDEKGLWIGFTRDYQEMIRTYSGYPVEIDLDEYIKDLLLYKDIDFEEKFGKETQEVYDLILDFLLFAKQTNQTVIVENG